MNTRGTLAEWLKVLGVYAILAVLVTHWDGKPAEWITAVATSTLAITAAIGLVGVFWPIQAAKDKRQLAHFNKLNREVIEPVYQELIAEKMGVVARTTLPVIWIHGQGLVAKEYTGPAHLGWVHKRPSDSEAFKQLYEHTKVFHFEGLLKRRESFITELDGHINVLVGLTKDLQTRLLANSNLQEYGLNSTTGCYHGSLAFYMFCRLWQHRYWPLKVFRETTNVDYGWVLKCDNIMTTYAYGTEGQMIALEKWVEETIRTENQAKYISTTEHLHEELKNLVTDFTKAMQAERLQGECEITRA